MFVIAWLGDVHFYQLTYIPMITTMLLYPISQAQAHSKSEGDKYFVFKSSMETPRCNVSIAIAILTFIVVVMAVCVCLACLVEGSPVLSQTFPRIPEVLWVIPGYP